MVVESFQPRLPGLAEAPVLYMPDPPAAIGQAEVSYIQTQEILTKATGFMDAYDFTLNPYAGCSFGCTYCYAAFFGRTRQDLNSWGSWVKVKENAVDLLMKHKQGSLDGKLIYMSSVTDPYQPIERKLNLTRRLLEILAERHNPKLVVQTRSPDVVRDCDLFRQIEINGGRVQVNMTVTTDDEEVRRVFEPSCPSNVQRLNAISEVQAQGIESCITMTPLIWVEKPYTFANALLETGVQKFIVQPFHFQRGKFIAGTRDTARRLMAERLECNPESFQQKYMERYEYTFNALDAELPNLGQGKDGFSPPF